MRELHAAWHEHGGRHRRGHDAIAPADIHLARVHDSPKHEAHDSLKLRMLLDPEARKAERLKYQQKVEATEAAYTAKHAKPGSGDQRQAPEQPRPRGTKPEHTHPETRERQLQDRETKAALAEVDERSTGLPAQAEKKRKPERSWLPSNETTQFAASIGALGSGVSDALNLMPGRWDAVVASALAAVVTGVAWGNKRWKDRHEDRSQG